jgi:hypothetical protein
VGWKLVKDHLWTPEKAERWCEKPRTGLESAYYKYNGGTMQVRTFDDDGELYYTALCDDEDSAERFHDWSLYDSGSVRSQIRKDENSEWEEFIS